MSWKWLLNQIKFLDSELVTAKFSDCYLSVIYGC